LRPPGAPVNTSRSGRVLEGALGWNVVAQAIGRGQALPAVPPQATVSRDWRRFSDEFAKNTDRISHELSQCLVGLPSFHVYDTEELFDACRGPITALGSMVAEQKPFREAMSVVRLASAAHRDHGIPLDEQFQAWNLGFEVLRTWVRDRVGPGGPELELALLDVIARWVNEGMVVTAKEYAAGQRSFREIDRGLDVFVRGALSGSMGPQELRAQCRTYGLDPHALYHAIRAPLGDKATLREMEDWLARRGTWRSGVLTVVGDIWGFSSQLPESGLRFAVGVSDPMPLESLVVGFRFATRAMETALALGLGGVHSIESLGPYAAVLDDRDVGSSLVARYVTPFVSQGSAGVEILKTVAAYLENNGHVETAASSLFMHPNTLRYRVRRFEMLTGASIRETRSLVRIWWALEHWRLTSGA